MAQAQQARWVGKCDAEFTGLQTDAVWGVLFEIDRSENSRLDNAAGLHQGYEEKEVDNVTAGGEEKKALMYYAMNKDALLRPYDWYKAMVVAGAREHGLPDLRRSAPAVAVKREREARIGLAGGEAARTPQAS